MQPCVTPSSETETPVSDVNKKGALEFSLFSLNCWGLWCISKDRRLRLECLAQYITQCPVYTFLCLQEIWVTSDYEYLRKKFNQDYPYSVRFSSGVVGSGLCFFSKVRIDFFFFFPFQVNGYFYKVWHGDWFAGKGVGVCTVTLGGLQLNIFMTHTHVETKRKEYFCHRITQMLSIVDVIHMHDHSSRLPYASILVGDLNCKPNEMHAKLLLLFTGMKDTHSVAKVRRTHMTLCALCSATLRKDQAHDTRPASPSIDATGPTHTCDDGCLRDVSAHCFHEGTYGLPSNAYTSSHKARNYDGYRFDYILFSDCLGSSGRLCAVSYDRPLPSRIPSCPRCSYSDHEAVAVKFVYINKGGSRRTQVEMVSAGGSPSSCSSRQLTLSPDDRSASRGAAHHQDEDYQKQELALQVLHILTEAAKVLMSQQRLSLCLALLLLVLLFLSFFIVVKCSSTLQLLTNVARLLLTGLFFVMAFIHPVVLLQERRAIDMSLSSLRLKMDTLCPAHLP